MINNMKQDAERRMTKTIESFQLDLSKMRTGRAHAGLLDHIVVPYYGADTPLTQIASVSVSDARTLVVSPWEKNLIPVIEKAIRSSDLGLNPAASGDLVRVPLPPLNEERRKELIKVVRQEAENAKVAVRNIRRDANNDLRNHLKDKSISEDEVRQGEDVIQKLTDKYIADIDKLLASKEKELLEV
ncbi:MAG: ribosome recycling factor [Gammaproteobacteria bacterium]